MTTADSHAFAVALGRVAAVCGRRMTDELARVYFEALQDLPLDALERACSAFARTVETGRRFPSPRELREWVSQRGRPAPGLTDDEHTRVWLRVAEDMNVWLNEGHSGSAWPAFELAWHSAVIAEGLTRRVRPTLDRQRCWQRWLRHGATEAADGPTATREQVEAIYRDVAPQCSPLFATALRDIADRIAAARERDPGEEG